MSENESAVSRGASHSTGMKPYIEFIQYCLKPCIPNNGHIHRSLEFTFDPGDFVCDPSKIISRGFERLSDGLVGAR